MNARALAAGAAALALLAAGGARAATAAQATAAVERGATAFYRVYLDVRPAGVPGARARQSFAAVVSPQLADLLQRAEAAERRHRTVTRNAEPPLAQGDLFTSLFEGAQTFSVRECHRSSAGGAVCSIELAYGDGRETTRWADTLFLVRHGGRWLVDDIEYGGDWQFMHKGRLRELLRRVIRDGNNARPLRAG